MKSKLVVSTVILCGILLIGYSLAMTVNIRNHRFNEHYSEKLALATSNILFKRFDCPQGYIRKNTPSTSFEAWLRNASLKNNGTAVKLFDGSFKGNQNVHFAVL